MRRIRRNGKKKIVIVIALLFIAFCASVYFIRFYNAKKAEYKQFSEPVMVSADLSREVYSIEDGYITGILPETTFRDLKNNLDEADIVVYDKNDNRLLYSQYVGTGMKLEYGGRTYKLVVKGDVTGNGRVGIADLIQMRLALVGARDSFIGEYAKAADITNTGNMTIGDIIKSNLTIVNIIDMLAPTSFVPEVRTTMNTITVTGETADANSGVKEYWFEIDGEEWVKNENPLESTYTFSGLEKATIHSVRMKVVDNEGNAKITKKVKVRTRSTENADIDIVLSNENWTNQNIMASVYYNAYVEGAIIKISLNNGVEEDWPEYTGPISVSKNTMIKVKVIGEEGQVLAENEKAVDNIDKLDPNPFDISTTVVNNNITIKVGLDETPGTTDAVDVNGEYGCSEIAGYIYQIYNNEWSKTSEQTTDTSYTFENLDEGKEYAIIVTAKDNAGNTKQQNDVANSKVTIASSEPTAYMLTIDANGGTYTGETTITNIEGESYELNTPTKTGSTFSGWVLTNGAGNVNESEGKYTYTFGKGNATIKAIWTSNTAEDTEPPVIVTIGNPTKWTNQDVNLTIKVIDSSDIKSFKVNDEAKALTNGEYTFTVRENESFTIIAIDNNDNQTTETVVVDKIDKIAPTVTFSQQSNMTSSSTHEVTLTVTEEDSGKCTYKYLWSESSDSPRSEESYTDYFSSGATISKRGLSGYYYLHVYMKDNAGNVEITKTSGRFYFKTEYTLTIDANGGTYTGETTITNIEGESYELNTPTKTGSTFSGWVLTNGAGNINESEGKYTYTFGKGNATIKAIWTSNTADDTEAPVIVTIGNPTEWTNKNVNLTIKVIDSSDIKSFKINGITKALTNGEYTFTVRENESFTIIAIDNNDNQSTETVVVDKIDKTAPTIEFIGEVNNTVQGTHTVELKIGDGDIENSSGIYTYKYLWSTSLDSPRSEGDYEFIEQDFEYGDSITISKRGLSGAYYLHIYVKDWAGNVTIKKTGRFYFRYEINNEEEWNQFAHDVWLSSNDFMHISVYLMADIDLSDNVGLVGNFRGQFYGNGHKIGGLVRNDISYRGIFSENYGSIVNVKVESSEDHPYLVYRNYGTIKDCTFSANTLNAMCGENRAGGLIENCVRTGSITQVPDEHEGAGIIEYNEGEVKSCYNEANVNVTFTEYGCEYAGVANRNFGTIYNCYNTGNIKFAENSIYIAGVCSRNSGIIQRCYNTGRIEGNNCYAGGISAVSDWKSGIIEECYNAGGINVTNAVQVGGISARLSSYDQIRNCYNTGDITGTGNTGYSAFFGGITGILDSTALVQNCYNTGNVTASGTGVSAGKIVGYNYENVGCIRNCYYISGTPVGSGRNEGCTQGIPNYMNLDSSAWKNDDSNINNGYPILKYINYNT